MTEERRPWAAIPSRAVGDDRLDLIQLRTLAALGYHANRAGVCWPSLPTLAEVTGLHRKTIQAALKHLIAVGMVRPLQSDPTTQQAVRGRYSRRYQVLWNVDDRLPKLEAINEARAFQHKRDVNAFEEERGPGIETQQHASQPEPPAADVARLVAAWAAGVERRWGIRPADLERARRDAQAALYKAPIGEVLAAMEAELDRRIAAGKSLPLRLT